MLSCPVAAGYMPGGVVTQSSHVFRTVEAPTFPFWVWRVSQCRQARVATLHPPVPLVSLVHNQAAKFEGRLHQIGGFQSRPSETALGHRVRALSPGLARRSDSLSAGFLPWRVPLSRAGRSTLLSLFKQGSHEQHHAPLVGAPE